MSQLEIFMNIYFHKYEYGNKIYWQEKLSTLHQLGSCTFC